MTHAYADGLNTALLSLAWCAGILTVLAAVAALIAALWWTVETSQRINAASRIRRAEQASGRIPGI